MFIAAIALWSNSVCPLNSGGVSPRVPLYSGYSTVLNDSLDRSKATAMWVGFSVFRIFKSIEMNPWTALVGCPLGALKLSGLRA